MGADWLVIEFYYFASRFGIDAKASPDITRAILYFPLPRQDAVRDLENLWWGRQTSSPYYLFKSRMTVNLFFRAEVRVNIH